MPDWSSVQEQTKETGTSSYLAFSPSLACSIPPASYSHLIFACFGLYVWEVFQTSDFELSVLQGRRKLRWQWVRFLPFFVLPGTDCDHRVHRVRFMSARITLDGSR